MDEPIKKRAKIEEIDIERVLGVFQQHLLRNCLCTFSEFELQKLYNVLRTDSTSRLTRNQKLLLITSIQLICDIAIKQNSKSHICAGIANICNTFARYEAELTDYFLKLSEDSDQYISFATSRAVSSFFIIVRTHNDQRLMDEADETDEMLPDQEEEDDQILLNSVTASLVECSRLGSESFSLDTVSFSLDVLKRLIEWREVEVHTLEDSSSEDDNRPAAENCRALTVVESQRIDFMQIKCLCINSLKSSWPVIVTNFNNLIAGNDPMYDYHIITFLNLWETIISVKANLSVNDTKLFYSNLDTYIQLLSPNTPPIIWKHILSLLNEVLCYGSTLALQDVLAKEPCDLAHSIVRNVKDVRNRNRNILYVVPYREGSGRFGGGAGDGDKVLLKRLILLILKAVAVTVKETRYDSSSDSSLGSEMEEMDSDMALIARSIEEVLDQLDASVKQIIPFHPRAPLAQWIVQVFTDQDDYLIESMVCCLDVAVGLCYRENASAELRQKLNPTITFFQFLQTVSFDANVLLDFLVSNETCFLLYILRYLKYACKNWREFVESCPDERGRIINVLANLRKSIKDLVKKELFPYNIGPVLKLLKRCTKCSST